MKAHTFGCLILLALIKSFSCDLFKLEDSSLTAAEGSCIEIKCEVLKEITLHNAFWFWMKDAIWTEGKDYSATIIYSSNKTQQPVSPHFAKRVEYVGSPSKSWGNGKSSEPYTWCSILIQDLKKTDTGNYSFRFIGREKWVTKPFMNLTVTENPCLLTFEGSKNVTENDTVTLTCSTSSSCPSDPEIKITSGQLSPLSTKSQKSKETTLSFNATWEDDGSMFSCQTENNSDKCLIRNISLTVGYAPKSVSANTSSTIVKEGQSVTLTCSAKGQPNPSFKWMKNNKVHSTEASWTIPSVKKPHTGSYHCTAQNSHGIKNSEEVTINVTYVPDVDIQISQESQRNPKEFMEGYRINFTCSAKRSNPPPLFFTWLKDKKTLKQGQTYVVEHLKPEDSGNYTCKAENTVGSGSKTLELLVRYKPRNTRISLKNTTVKIGGSLQLTCETDAYPHELSYSWYRYRSDSSQKTFMGSRNPLTLMKVQRAYDAWYICNASNIVDRGDTSEPVHIQVLFPPSNTKLHMTDEVTEGQTVTVRCAAESFPSSSFTLAGPLTSNSQTPESILPTNDSYNFAATSAHAGFYICKATNSEGSLKSPKKKLVVKYIPKEVKVEARPGLVIKENESLTLDCSAKSYPSVNSIIWMKATDGQNKSTIGTQMNFTVKSASVSDSGWYSCTATNKIGTGNSEQVEVKVKYGPKYTKIIKGQEVQHEDGTYSVTLTCISRCYPPVEHYSWYWRTGEKQKEKVSSHQNTTVSSLQYGEHYCVARNEIGEKASEPIRLFDDTVTTILKFFFLCLVLLILCVIFLLYRRKRNRLTQRGTTNARACGGCLGWRNGVRRSSGNRIVVTEPFRSRDDLLPDQPCRPNAQRHERHPDSTTASNINTVYSTVNLPKGKQAASAQKNPTRAHGGHMENDSLNYASLDFVKKKKDPAEDAEYSVVSKPKKSKENEQERLQDYENISTVAASKPPYTYDFDTDTDTSEDDVEINYTQVNFKPKSGHQKARNDSSSSSSSSSEDRTQYSEVKI
ncbi:B-cell receptor CD22-like [Archocentrus centrarchus]|uniref:B-cell receptor CD22-like n=1 Tax=Archocentrus centrarchus TaxID=63155 RepID=UPI0011EA1282|nr:B-cell receptor CD22-like [Archocentrus centrarchus]